MNHILFLCYPWYWLANHDLLNVTFKCIYSSMYICYHIVVTCIVDPLYRNQSVSQSINQVWLASITKVKTNAIWSVLQVPVSLAASVVHGFKNLKNINIFYAPAIRRMRKGIKRCPCPSVRPSVCPSVRPCVLPFVHHLGRYFVSATPPTIFSQSFWNFTGVFVKDWRCAWHLDITLRLTFVTFFTVWT